MILYSWIIRRNSLKNSMTRSLMTSFLQQIWIVCDNLLLRWSWRLKNWETQVVSMSDVNSDYALTHDSLSFSINSWIKLYRIQLLFVVDILIYCVNARSSCLVNNYCASWESILAFLFSLDDIMFPWIFLMSWLPDSYLCSIIVDFSKSCLYLLFIHWCFLTSIMDH